MKSNPDKEVKVEEHIMLLQHRLTCAEEDIEMLKTMFKVNGFSLPVRNGLLAPRING